MIYKRYLTQWLSCAPWPNLAQTEQDLVLSRVITEIYQNDFLRDNLVFRGGTALHKLFFSPPLRYSEDIDLVQFKEGPIGNIITVLRKTLDPWLGKPKWKQSQGRFTLYYGFETESSPIQKMKIKIEINTREHDSFLPLLDVPFSVGNGWFSGEAMVRTYCLEELLATKLRALYQRRKGRDLFDLDQAFLLYPKIDCLKLIACFQYYLMREQRNIARTAFEENIALKLQDPIFQEDIRPLISAKLVYDPRVAYEHLHNRLIQLLP